EELSSAASLEAAGATSTGQLREVEHKFLGKTGSIPGLMKLLGGLSKEERPAFGARVNAAKTIVEQIIENKFAELKAKEQLSQFEAERIDITMPGERPLAGREHILQQATNKIKRVLGGMGFRYLES